MNRTESRLAWSAPFLLGLAAALLSASCMTVTVPGAAMPELGGLADGAYEGSWDAGLVKASVRATVAAGLLEGVEILSHDCSPIGKKAEPIVERVVEAQSLEVDIVSGATGSSLTILKAIEEALNG